MTSNATTRYPVTTQATARAALLMALACAGGATVAAGTAAQDAFSGPLDPANWTLTRSGPVFGSGVNTGGAPASIRLIGGDDVLGVGCPDNAQAGFTSGCEVRYTINLPGTFSFRWDYSTADITPGYDQFGVIVDGARMPLVAFGGDVTQGGNYTVNVASSFGWYINCTDCNFGGAQVVLSNVSAVPEAGSAALLAVGITGLAGVTTLRRQRRRG